VENQWKKNKSWKELMEFLKEKLSDFSQQFYVCGPQPMVEGVSEILKQLGANPDGITFEE
jgi:ferredoxin-NADP reductase